MTTLVAIDAQSIVDVATSLSEFGSRYTHRLFTQSEIESCEFAPDRAAARYAGFFAAKEAVLKLLDLHDEIPPWTSVEVRLVPSGRTEVYLQGVAAEMARRQGVMSLSLTISIRGTVATAVVAGDIKR